MTGAPRGGARGAARRLPGLLRLTWRAAPAAATGHLAVVAAGGLVPPAAAWVTKLLLDRLTGGGAVLAPVLALAVLGAVLAMTSHLTRYLDAQVRREVGLAMQDRLFASVNAFTGVRRFEDPRFLDRIRMAQQAGQTTPMQLVSAVFMGVQSALTLAGFVTALLVISAPMTAFVLVSALPLLLVELRLARRRAEFLWGTSPAARRQGLFAGLQTDVRAATEIRLYGLGGWFRERMLGETRAINRAERTLDRRVLGGQGGLALAGALVAGAGLVWAVLRVRAGVLTVGDIALFAAAVGGTQGSLEGIVARAADGYQALLVLAHYEAVVNAGPDLPAPAVRRRAPELRAGIELRDVWFRYADGHPWALRGISLTIPAGRATALVGRNGAGKSTLVKLLCRLYDPTRGAILWDGVDLRDIPPEELRERIGAVFQHPVGYDLTARENIGIGDLSALHDLDRIRAAAVRAGVDAKLAGLPDGYDTMLGREFFSDSDADGVMLSGGQWQRVALARAFLRDARDLLVLDEPGTGLDAAAEHAVHRRLREHRAGRTSLLISHRLSAVRDADAIVVLAGGEVAETGDHAALMRAGGEYAGLFRLQADGYRLDDTEEDPAAGPSPLTAR
ncbi:ABC transporter ATP-binding protein [Actinomadura macrotermitis]|uniref:Vitamin B12 import ATP-binding protein BtuD n=1 Tax=Actinomadura macrotermitis TaxID=2585200 RepID=A0A7K0C4X0_9ACTN|nr:Vitamin B12 import ATP-binding protein BtuD [Actinomadura macrotermitis]